MGRVRVFTVDCRLSTVDSLFRDCRLSTVNCRLAFLLRHVVATVASQDGGTDFALDPVQVQGFRRALSRFHRCVAALDSEPVNRTVDQSGIQSGLDREGAAAIRKTRAASVRWRRTPLWIAFPRNGDGNAGTQSALTHYDDAVGRRVHGRMRRSGASVETKRVSKRRKDGGDAGRTPRGNPETKFGSSPRVRGSARNLRKAGVSPLARGREKPTLSRSRLRSAGRDVER